MRAFIIILIIIILIFLTGCSSLPTKQKLGQAAHRAFFNPQTLVPLVGAGVFYIGGFDEKVSRWAVKYQPIYGSKDKAVSIKNSIKTILKIEAIATVFAIPSGQDYSKIKTLAVGIAAQKAVGSTTNLLKNASGRIRPDESNDLSLPSGCTSGAFSSATLSNRNIDYIEWMSDDLKSSLQFSNICLASSVAWSRVESGSHYPSDVLVGAALGYFLSAFIYDAFLGLPENKDDDIVFAVVPFEGGAMAQVSFSF